MVVTHRRLMMLALCLAVQLSAGASVALSFGTSSLRGRWTVHLEPATSFGGTALGNGTGVTAAKRQHLMRVGYIDWDGLGGASGRFIATTDTNPGQTMIIDYQWTGTYLVNPDGSGTLSITAIKAMPAPVCTPNPPPELVGVCTDYIAPSPASPVPAYVGNETFALMIGKKNGVVELVQQNNTPAGAKIFLQGEAFRQFRITTPFFFTAASLTKTWAVRLEPATSFAAIDPTNAGGVTPPSPPGAPRQDVMRVGWVKFDGFGAANGQMISTTDDSAGTTVIVNYMWVGSYTMNSDGTGTLSILPAAIPDTACTPAQLPSGTCATFEGPETYAFTVSKSRQEIDLIQTDNLGGGAKIFLRGTAQPQ
jgi:hypothetical protein